MLSILIAVIVALVAVLAYAAAKPGTFRVERAASIKAPPETIFPLINDFQSWRSWSPYEKLDPAMKRTFSGAARGKGAAYAWESSGKAGVGRMEIVEDTEGLKLDFTKPLKAHNMVDFTLDPQGDTTSVIWAMYGPNLYIGKVMGLFINMDRMVGKDFETGLANLKTIAES